MFLDEDIEELLEMEDLVNIDGSVSESLGSMIPVVGLTGRTGVTNSYVDKVVPNQVKKTDPGNKPICPVSISEASLLYVSTPSITYNEYIDESVNDDVFNFGAETDLSANVRKTILKSSMNKVKLEKAKAENADHNIVTDIMLETVALQKELNSYKKNATEEQLAEMNMLIENSLTDIYHLSNDNSDTILVQEGIYSISPVKKLLKTLEKIRKERPDEYSNNSEVKKFVDNMYDEVIKIADLTEEDIKHARKDALISSILHILLYIGSILGSLGLGAIGAANLGLVIITIGPALSMISLIVSAFCNDARVSQNHESVNELTKIEAGLKKINIKKLPKPYAKKIKNMINKIEDVRTEEGRLRAPYLGNARESTIDTVDDIDNASYINESENIIESAPITKINFTEEFDNIFESVALSSEYMDVNDIYA